VSKMHERTIDSEGVRGVGDGIPCCFCVYDWITTFLCSKLSDSHNSYSAALKGFQHGVCFMSL